MIKVLHEGIYNTIQDQGRFGYAKMGIPTSGYLDAYSAELGNALLNNQKSDAVVEITFGQGKFQFKKPTVFCLTGGDFSPKLDGNLLEMNQVYKAQPDAVLSFGKRNSGARTYLTVQGGIQSKEVLNSRSFSKGITQIRLQKNDELRIQKQQPISDTGHSRVKEHEKHFESEDLACFAGPEFDRLNDKQKKRLSEPFTLSSDNNRVGYRLNEELENDLHPILTSSVLPGTVQLTPSGKLIALMNDCQVSGGYPRVLQLSEYAISRMSQKMAGEEVRFTMQDFNL
ncbi:5-oxoprolinase subunit C family protein [Salibacter halophilus]|uniref:Biotin-dependent carboxyltransferase family protein n=1 Tax=Salibacter halophilus TaxID=1803916 RepID=A0A6N6MBM7_9FLAO|nr:biotin-dependent carboxyltransferase family protein [Salibacter halophilus]KAB1065947.1 biotin-dependent carboxyltransferase family protein [Salibacter halophilus]